MPQQNTLDQKLDLYSKQNRTHRQRKKIDASLLGYSVAAGMAMVVPDAMAAIVSNTNSFSVFATAFPMTGSTSGSGSALPASSFASWDIDGDGNVDARVEVLAQLGGGSGSEGRADFRIYNAGASFGIMSLYGSARNLYTFETVPQGVSFMPSSAGGGVFGNTNVSNNVSGSFLPGSIGYIGLRFSGGTGNVGTQFAWAKILFDGYGDAVNGPVFSSLTILEWAYDDSGAPIRVGAVSAVPLPSAAGLMLLGLGSLGLTALRKRKQQYLEKQQAKTETA